MGNYVDPEITKQKCAYARELLVSGLSAHKVNPLVKTRHGTGLSNNTYVKIRKSIGIGNKARPSKLSLPKPATGDVYIPAAVFGAASTLKQCCVHLADAMRREGATEVRVDLERGTLEIKRTETSPL